MTNYSIMTNPPDELYHFGVQGMKWGVRRFQNKDGSLTAAGKKRYDDSKTKKNYDEKKAAYKNAKKEYNKSFNEAYNRSGIHITKKGREEDQKRWEDSYNKLEKMESAKADYKQAKSERKMEISRNHADIGKSRNLGERLTYNDVTWKTAAKYMTDKNMTVDEAISKAKGDASRNTAIFVAGYGALLAGSIYLGKKY